MIENKVSISTLTTPFNAVEQVLVNVIRKKKKEDTKQPEGRFRRFLFADYMIYLQNSTINS